MGFSIKDIFSKCDQIRSIHLLKKTLMENFIFLQWCLRFFQKIVNE